MGITRDKSTYSGLGGAIFYLVEVQVDYLLNGFSVKTALFLQGFTIKKYWEMSIYGL